MDTCLSVCVYHFFHACEIKSLALCLNGFKGDASSTPMIVSIHLPPSHVIQASKVPPAMHRFVINVAISESLI